ncbi:MULTISPECIES: hypothetical protein [unclassified Streptomyces]|uniref:hypothetical protein n=1 Tax=unclassified Streptomyces TaxID=2593676 RepID=UPI000BAC77EB|nr:MULTISPECIES: hypothetical protein [unclassified Streptomyces]ASY37004.1 hypothetical protein CAC01_30675 [Streptomyces sp. CLI2509]MYX20437.1 hypothetical protein [Streptomyces sp. SID8380]
MTNLPTSAPLAQRALTSAGLTSYYAEDVGNSWLVVGADADTAAPGFPAENGGSHAVLYLYNPARDSLTVDDEPAPGLEWHVLTSDHEGRETLAAVLPHDELANAVSVIRWWVQARRYEARRDQSQL